VSSITDVRGIRVGHWTDARALTGCTVVLVDGSSSGGVDVRGGAPGTIGTDSLGPLARVQGPNAILLTGGSSFGLAAAAGVMRWHEERGIGLRLGPAIVPIVAGAVVFDLRVGDPSVRPDAEAGYAACEAASAEEAREGAVGAGTGASVGKRDGTQRQGGLGTASARAGDWTVGALFVVNAVGDVVDERGARIDSPAQAARGVLAPGESTVIGVVATDARLSKAHANALARVAHDGIARAVRLSHTSLDGDAVFAIATGQAGEADLDALGAAAQDASAEAIRRAIRSLSLAGP
jgi:L-aminopeptidase/D-esterase-like protein